MNNRERLNSLPDELYVDFIKCPSDICGKYDDCRECKLAWLKEEVRYGDD